MEIVTGRTSLGVEKDLKMPVVNDVQVHLEATEPRRQVLWGSLFLWESSQAYGAHEILAKPQGVKALVQSDQLLRAVT